MAASILIVFYSMTGNTKRIAEELRDAIGADLADIEEIVERRPRAGPRGAFRGMLDSFFRRTPSIQPRMRNPSDYRLVILGTPIWAGRICGPMRSYATELGPLAENVAFFCTAGGSESARAFGELGQRSGHSPRASLTISAKELDPVLHRDGMQRFASLVRAVADGGFLPSREAALA